MEQHKYVKPARDPLLVEREKTHGSFARNSEIWRRLMMVEPMPPRMVPPQQLALTMIYLKIARMMYDPNVKDHWDDIAGYAKLGAEACE